MYRSVWGQYILFQISVAGLAPLHPALPLSSAPSPAPLLPPDSLEVFSILLTAEDDGLPYPEFIFLNVSGLVLARRGAPATLHCSVRLLGGWSRPRYRVRWTAGAPGGPPVARLDQSQGLQPWVEPGYRDRVTLRSRGPHNYLRFRRVTAADFGEYTVTAQVAGSDGEPFTFVSMLAEVPHPTKPPSPTSSFGPPSHSSSSGTPTPPSSPGTPSHSSLSGTPSPPSSPGTPSPLSAAVAPAALACTRTPHVVALNTSTRVKGFLGAQVTLHCQVLTAPACPDTRYRLRWEALGTGRDQKRTVTLAQEDQASGEPPRLHASYHYRLNMSSRGPETQLRISKLRRDDPKKYRCVAGIAGVDGEVSSRTIHLRKLGRKLWNTHTQTAILMLSVNVLLFFMIVISFRISIGSQSKGQKPPGIVSESHRKMKIFGV